MTLSTLLVKGTILWYICNMYIYIYIYIYIWWRENGGGKSHIKNHLKYIYYNIESQGIVLTCHAPFFFRVADVKIS